LRTAATLLHRLLSEPTDAAGAIAASARQIDTAAPASDGTIDVRAFTAHAMRMDRMEYRSLAVALDTAFEAVQSATAHVYALRAVDAAPPLVALAALLVDASVMLDASVPDAGIHAPTLARAGTFAELQKRGDALYYAGVGALFSGSPDAAEVLQWKDMYDIVHQALGRCADAADVLTRIGE
jgi:hypothetical protein